MCPESQSGRPAGTLLSPSMSSENAMSSDLWPESLRASATP
jgi:hypothetical protein